MLHAPQRPRRLQFPTKHLDTCSAVQLRAKLRREDRRRMDCVISLRLVYKRKNDRQPFSDIKWETAGRKVSIPKFDFKILRPFDAHLLSGNSDVRPKQPFFLQMDGSRLISLDLVE
ncbi:hypothetical protein D3C76_465450 [compost metagenome]